MPVILDNTTIISSSTLELRPDNSTATPQYNLSIDIPPSNIRLWDPDVFFTGVPGNVLGRFGDSNIRSTMSFVNSNSNSRTQLNVYGVTDSPSSNLGGGHGIRLWPTHTATDPDQTAGIQARARPSAPDSILLRARDCYAANALAWRFYSQTTGSTVRPLTLCRTAAALFSQTAPLHVVNLSGTRTSPAILWRLNGTASTTARSILFFGYYRSANGWTNSAHITITSTAVALANLSDYRKKTNIQALSHGLEIVRRLRPISYRSRDTPEGDPVQGFIAHELQEIIPRAVTGQRDEVDSQGKPRYQMVSHQPLIPYMVSALKTLRAKIQDLESRTRALQERRCQ